MQSHTITVTSRIDPNTFYRFAVFDTLKLRKRWLSPAVFAGIFLLCSLICFLMRERTESAAFLGTVLLAVGFGVPAVYFGTFFRSLKLQSKALKLKSAAVAYTVKLDEKGIHVISGKSVKDHVAFSWEQIFGVYEQPGCIYLYVSTRQAFLLPEASMENNGTSMQELRDLLTAHLKSDKLHFTASPVK